jgi:hypothetical protein
MLEAIANGIKSFLIYLKEKFTMPNLQLSWDAMPVGETWTAVRIYEGTTKVAEVAMPATSIVLSVAKAEHVFVARSFDATQQTDWQESVDSTPVTVKPPLPPVHLKR